MKTVGDVLREIEGVNIAIEDLHMLREQYQAQHSTYCVNGKDIYSDAIFLLANYRRTLCELHIQK